MTFTQYKFPDGRQVQVSIDRPKEIEALADTLEKAGWSFEIEMLSDMKTVHMDCCNIERALTNRVCKNGPEVPGMVDELVSEAYALWRSEIEGVNLP